jgi:transposase
VRDEIEGVIAKRDYRSALTLQCDLLKSAAHHDRLPHEYQEAEFTQGVKLFELAGEKEQKAALDFVNERIAAIRGSSAKAYDELQVRRRQTIEELQNTS